MSLAIAALSIIEGFIAANKEKAKATPFGHVCIVRVPLSPPFVTALVIGARIELHEEAQCVVQLKRNGEVDRWRVALVDRNTHGTRVICEADGAVCVVHAGTGVPP